GPGPRGSLQSGADARPDTPTGSAAGGARHPRPGSTRRVGSAWLSGTWAEPPSDVEIPFSSGRLTSVIVPLLSWPITTLSIILIILSALLAASVLLHKGSGGGMSDLFGGGMSSSMG